MYNFSEKAKKKIIELCFDDVCESAQKEEAGAIRGILNSVVRASVYFDVEKNVAVVEKKNDLAVNFTYKLLETKRRIQIIEKIEEPYIFEVELEGKKITAEYAQYRCKCFE